MTDQAKFVLVPTEPTDDMIKEGIKVKWQMDIKWGPRVAEIYKAMLAAASECKTISNPGDDIKYALIAALQGARATLVHEVPHDCWATGPLTGDPVEDLIVCPGCRAIHRIDNALAKASP